MTDATLQTPRRPGGFKFERYASAFLLLAAVLLYVGIVLIEGQTRYLSVDNLVYGLRWAVRWGPLEVADICDSQRMDCILAEHQPDAVMHFAAYTDVGESVTDPAKYYRNNVAGTLNLVRSTISNNSPCASRYLGESASESST